ncbi:MAG: hypothetical protein ACAI44_23255 [Candidatus Sericytochromatia bacterium]
MNTVRQTGAAPQFGSVQEAGAQAPIGQAPSAAPSAAPQAAPAPQIQLEPQDQVSQSAGASGRAAPVEIVGPQSAQIRELLTRKDFDAIAALVNKLGVRGIGHPDLSLTEIKAIASGLGQDSTFARFTAEERQAVQALLLASQISPNQKLEGLNQLLGADTALSYIRTSSPSELSKLSFTNRKMMLDQLVSSSSTWGSIKGAANEVVNRRYLGNSQQGEDRIASKLLRASRNEQELRELLGQMNQFSRDDVAFRYVMDLSAQELAGLSDAFKQELMASLIDTGVSFYGLNLDLNNVANIDETLNMTFKEHAEAAKRLYVALRPEARKSSEVQALVAKSDVMMQQISQIEQSLNQDLQAGKLTEAKIKGYRAQLQSLQTQYPNQPDVQQKVGDLLKTLSKLQEGLNQAAQVRIQGTSALAQTQVQLKQTQASLKATEGLVQKLNGSLKASETKLGQAESKLLAQLGQLAALRGSAEQLGEEFTGLLAQAEALQQKGSLRGQMPELDQLLAKLQQAESKLQGLSGEQTLIHTQLGQIRTQLTQQRQEYADTVKAFNGDRDKLSVQTQQLGQLLQSYSAQIGQLEANFATARTQLDGLDQTALPEAERGKLQQELDAARRDIDSHQASYQKLDETLKATIVPAAQQIEAGRVALQPQQQAVEQSFARVEDKLETAETIETSVGESTAQVKSALELTKEKAVSLNDNLRGKLSNMSRKQLEQAKTDIDKMVQQLKAEDASGEQIQDELGKLGELKGMIQELTDALNNSQDVQKSLGSTLKQLKLQSDSMTAELGDATTALDQANHEVEAAQKTVQQTQQTLSELSSSMAAYEKEIQAWSTQLAELDQANDTSKQDFNKVLEPLRQGGKPTASVDPALSQQIELENKKLVDSFASIDSRRQKIQQQLDQLKGKMTGIRSEMDGQRKKLVDYQTVLSTKTQALQTTQAQVLELNTKLTTINSNNRSLLQESEAKLAQLSKQPKNKAVAAALEQASKRCLELRTQIKATEKLAGETTQQTDKLLLLNRNAQAVQQSLDQGITGIDGFMGGDLAKTQTAVTAVDQHFQELNQEKALLQTKAQDLMRRMQGGGITIDELRTELKAIFEKVKDGQTLGQLEGIGKTLMEVWQALEKGESLLAIQGQLLTDASTIQGQASQEIAAMAGLLAQLSTETGQMEQEVQEAQRGVLETQRSLLEQRRQLGIAQPEYQQALERYSQLLNSGRPLTSFDVIELQNLEKKLNSIETSLAQTSQGLSDRITAMNMLKSRVNSRLDTLNQKTAKLLGLRGKLMEVRGKLAESGTGLRQHLQDLRARRESLVQALDQLSKLTGIDGVAEYQQLKAQLTAALKSVDDQLKAIEGSIQAGDTAISGIDGTVAKIDESVVAANALKSRLEMVKGKIAEIQEQLGKLKKELDELQKLVGKLQSDLEVVKGEADAIVALNGGASQPSTTAAGASDLPGSDSISGTQRSDLSKQSFANKLTNQLTQFWGTSQRRSETKREEEHQAKRQAFLKDLEQRMQLSRQYQQELAEQNARSQGLEDITAHLVEQTLHGENLSSGLNVV